MVLGTPCAILLDGFETLQNQTAARIGITRQDAPTSHNPRPPRR